MFRRPICTMIGTSKRNMDLTSGRIPIRYRRFPLPGWKPSTRVQDPDRRLPSPARPLRLVSAEDQGHVVAAEAEGVVHHAADAGVTRGVGHKVEIEALVG